MTTKNTIEKFTAEQKELYNLPVNLLMRLHDAEDSSVDYFVKISTLAYQLDSMHQEYNRLHDKYVDRYKKEYWQEIDALLHQNFSCTMTIGDQSVTFPLCNMNDTEAVYGLLEQLKLTAFQVIDDYNDIDYLLDIVHRR